MNNRFWQSEANKFTLYGAIFGFLFPVIATLLRAILNTGSVSWSSIVEVQSSDPLLWIINSAPFFLGLFARFAGRRQDHLKELLRRSSIAQDELGEPPEDANQFAGVLSIIGMLLIAVVLVFVTIWLQRVILLNRTPAEVLNDAVGNATSNPIQVANVVAVATNTAVVNVQPTPLPPTPIEPPPTPTQLPPTPLPTPIPVIVFTPEPAQPTLPPPANVEEVQNDSPAPADNGSAENQPAESLQIEGPSVDGSTVATSTMAGPTVDAIPIEEPQVDIKLAYMDQSADCTFFTQIAAQAWQTKLGVTVELLAFATTDELYSALAASPNASTPLLTLCFVDPDDRAFLLQHTSGLQVIGKAFWRTNDRKLLAMGSLGTPSFLRQALPGVYNFLQNQDFGDSVVADQDPAVWITQNSALIQQWIDQN